MSDPLVAALAAAALTQAVNILLLAWTRRHERRRAALDDLRLAVLAMRDATDAYGRALREAIRTSQIVDDNLDLSVPADVWLAWRTARTRLQMTLSRVANTQIESAISSWWPLAEAHSVSWLEVSSAEEQRAFDVVVHALA